MCKHIAELLDAEQPFFSITLEQLERASGNSGVDVRLTAEIIGKVHQKTKELGLDPHDTTGKELYLALRELAKKHDHFIADRLGAKDPDDVNDMLSRIKAFVEQIGIPKNAWVIKHTVAKRLLKAHPPRRVMAQLRYRSIDSMLKREPIGEIFGALRFVESPVWLEGFLKKYKTLTPQDFEVREIEIIQLDPERWGSYAARAAQQKHHNITHIKEMGVILLLPLPMERMRGICITVLPMLFHYINEIRMYSSYFKLQQVSSNFGKILAETLLSDPGKHASVAGQSIHWRIIQRHYGNLDIKHHPEVFEPHLQPEDLQWQKAEEILYRIEPALHFWHDMDYVATTRHGQLISFNLRDIAADYVNNLSYTNQSTNHMREALWNEIFTRYMGQKVLERQVLNQLSHDALEPAALLLSVDEVF